MDLGEPIGVSRQEIEMQLLGSLLVGGGRKWKQLPPVEFFGNRMIGRLIKTAVELCQGGAEIHPAMVSVQAGFTDEEMRRYSPSSVMAHAVNLAITDFNIDFWCRKLYDVVHEERLAHIRGVARERLDLGDDAAAVSHWVAEEENKLRQQFQGDMPDRTIEEECHNVIVRALAGEKPEGLIYTGVDVVDQMTGGLLPADYMIIAARPSCGKTSLGLNICFGMANQAIYTTMFSLEMAKPNIAASFTAIVTGISARTMVREPHKLTNGDKMLIRQHADRVLQLAKYVRVYHNPGLKLAEMRAILRRDVADGTRLALMDHTMLTTEEGESETIRISRFSKGWKRLASDFMIPCIALAQINRDNVKSEREPKPSDLKQSGSLEEDCDILQFIHPPRGIMVDPREKVKIIQAKGRSVGVGFREAWFDGPSQRFFNLEQNRVDPVPTQTTIEEVREW